MNNKQKRMLELLDGQIQCCTKCNLHLTGRAKPYWTDKSKIIIIGEAPGAMEVESNTPFVGTAGKLLWETMNYHGFKREQFLIMNSVNCRPMDEKKNGKPNAQHRLFCKFWIHGYIKVLKPKAVFIVGNYAMDSMIGEFGGITIRNATMMYDLEYETNFIFSVHPMMCVYYGDNGKQMLFDSIKLLKENS